MEASELLRSQRNTIVVIKHVNQATDPRGSSELDPQRMFGSRRGAAICKQLEQ